MFHRDKNTKSGFKNKCKSCCNLYYTKNKEKILSKSKENRNKNQEEYRRKSLERYYKNHEKRKESNKRSYYNNIQKIKETRKKYRSENKQKLKEQYDIYYFKNKQKIIDKSVKYNKRKEKEDIQFLLRRKIRARIKNFLNRKGVKIKINHFTELGCSLDELRKHLESKFTEGMSWDNYGEWHIDHIKPLAKFNLEDPDQFKEACNYNNLQPLWAIDNLSKGAKFGLP
jgi:hypothetical protein